MRHTLNRNEKTDMNINGLPSICAAITGFLFVAAVAPCYAQDAPGTIFNDCDDCPIMVVIPPDDFIMGSERGEFVLNETRPETPVHRVTIRRAFAAGQTEVTNGQFGAFVEATGYRPSQACTKWRGEVEMFGGNWTDPDYGRPPRKNEPVVCVSWLDAKAYTMWLSGKTGEKYRLLSEAEWEYVARDGTQTTWPWGEDPDEACKTGNVFDQSGATSDYAKEHSSWDPVNCDDGHTKVAPAGSFPANSFGLHDLGGNVWEWNEDCSILYYADDAVDERPHQEQGHCPRRSVKGGSWFSMISRHRPAFRGRDPEPLASHIFGFRVARDL
jgi:formylglycine-generating enzyme required for sulfatase activity